LGEVPMALGGDQRGSIRIPASFCGIYGLKPTHSLVPYTGIMPIELTSDHTGPMTATVEDNALLLEILAGPDASIRVNTGRRRNPIPRRWVAVRPGSRLRWFKRGLAIRSRCRKSTRSSMKRQGASGPKNSDPRASRMQFQKFE
jgi:Asp-tRNA(Asn)/Glu-tRNA(Gln) amidotransferase A subunit family amidase